ncbi:hypothetical protein [Deinococcus peraridilitoris]|uniref:Uncharacterized protein n=1 Tax=Deinococcus peraridilitoris (strain DSM 19664 / LMG 22246 / CIP 109416 / KR-200) TaxID=937777 RepID=K9ZYQ7_DEIPD|nr:hypothetical protein [Deinococcus peraridilitoris]AFZ66334.1 hypothetical protein Deipe_0755 [Deinococcus peraridilitoris DSM 19664]
MPDPLDRFLARQARALGLSADTVNESDADTLRDFCNVVLRELGARGLLEEHAEPGCFASARETGN